MLVVSSTRAKYTRVGGIVLDVDCSIWVLFVVIARKN